MSEQTAADDESTRQTTDLSTLHAVLRPGPEIDQVCLTEQRALDYCKYVLCGGGTVAPLSHSAASLSIPPQALSALVVDQRVVALYRDAQTANACRQVHFDGDGDIFLLSTARAKGIPGQTGTQTLAPS